MNFCKCCGAPLDDCILEYKNMPKSAQNFPTLENLNYDKGEDLKVYQCRYCKLVQLASEPVPYYKSVIRATGFSNEMKEFRNNFFNEFVNKYNLKNKKIIEIGAGKGEYLEMFKNSTNINPYGLEYDKSNIENANPDLNIINGFIEDSNYKIENGPYDAFYIMNFLEHIPNPKEFLRGIYNNLKDDGVGIIEVPNFNMMLKEGLFSEFISDHVSYFTIETLKLIIENCGFKVEEISIIWNDYIISAIVRKKSNININTFIENKQKLTDNIKNYINDRLPKGKIVVWGAGHQALANLSLFDMENDISYVVDSASFKQNKYTHATHILITSPDILLNDHEIKTVIIMAGGYSDEIRKIILEKYNKNDLEISIMTSHGIEINNE